MAFLFPVETRTTRSKTNKIVRLSLFKANIIGHSIGIVNEGKLLIKELIEGTDKIFIYISQKN